MVEIREIKDKELWNKQLKKTISYNVFATYEWGEYKSSSWTIERIAFYKSGNFLGQVQLILKKKFNIVFAWNSGGLNLSNNKYIQDVKNSLDEYFKNKKYYLRFNFYNKSNGLEKFEISKTMQKPTKSINSGFSILHFINKDLDVVKKMNSNHRYYYKKALKNDLYSVFGNNEEDINNFVNLHNEMTTNKNLSSLTINKADIEKLSKCFKDNLLVFSVFNKAKEIVSSCIVLFFEDVSFYYLAASNENGRKLYASYFMIKELLEYLQDKGNKVFDFGGITPINKEADGVNKFKIGFGGEVVNYLGEWDITNSKALSFFVNKVYL